MNFDKYKTRGAYHYEWYDTEDWYKKCVDLAVDICQGNTLDIGGGDGVVASRIIANGYKAEVLDNDLTASDICEQRNIPFTAIDLNDSRTLVSVFEKYDYACSLNTIEHLTDWIAHNNLIRKAKKGAIIITDYPQLNPSKYHHKEFEPKEITAMFSDYRTIIHEIDKDYYGVEIRK